LKQALKKIWNAVTTVVVILIVILALLLVGVRLLGFQVFTVLSGSMEPAYMTGSLIYVKDVDPMTLTDGDVITFLLDEETVATHRIVGVVPDETDPTTIRFRTKGDANDFEDGQLVHYKNVIGTPVFTIPGLGYVANFIQHPPGLYYSIAAAVVILLLAFLPDLLEDEKPEKTPKKKKKKARDEEPDESLPCAKGRLSPAGRDVAAGDRVGGGGGSPQVTRRDCESPQKSTPVTIPQSASLHSADSPLCTKGPLVSNDAPAPTRRKKAVPTQVTTPQSRSHSIAPSSEGANPQKPPSDEGGAPKGRRERKTTISQPSMEAPRRPRPAPRAAQEPSYDLDDILAEFRND